MNFPFNILKLYKHFDSFNLIREGERESERERERQRERETERERDREREVRFIINR